MRAGTRYWTRPHGRPGRCRVGPAQAGRSQETRAAGGRSGAMTESHLSQEIDPDAAITEDSATNIESENGHLSHLDEGDSTGDDIAIVGAADTVEEVEGPPEVAPPAPTPTDVPAHTEQAVEPPVPDLSPPPLVPEACADPSRYGRVDTDGTVYVRTADGERAIGSWHAGDVDKALAHYALRF